MPLSLRPVLARRPFMKALHLLFLVLPAAPARFLMPALPDGIATHIRVRRTFAITRCQDDFQLDDLVPLRVGPLLLWNR